MSCSAVWLDLLFVLIETLWNVKVQGTTFGGRTNHVLIETLWNVKIIDTISPIDTQSVLIETLWNVKVQRSDRGRGRPGFNRNIVECKGTPYCVDGTIAVRFNRNIVECKVIIHTFQNCVGCCFNRNIVECKDVTRFRLLMSSFVLIETLWNVKGTKAPASVLIVSVLIETLWNVKRFM